MNAGRGKPPPRPVSLRTRVTVVVALGATVAITLSLTLLYTVLSQQLNAALDADLTARGQDLLTAVRAGDMEVPASDPLAQLYGADGALLAGSSSLNGDHRLLSSPDVRGRERAFVDDASHELRTPIAVLRGELELALSVTDDPAERERSLRAALAEAERLSRLAEDLLLLARHQAGAAVVTREPVDLLDLVTAEAGRLGRALGLRIEVSGEPMVVPADSDRLRQVFANLTRNSAAAGANNAHVTLARDEGWVLVELADDGAGFPTDLLDQAFERFVRADTVRTRGAAGAGLGLSIVHAVVTAHGGTVAAGNGGRLGGAVVTVRLPPS